jgi:hypothetical protein
MQAKEGFMAPGDMMPVVFGVTLPSAATWLFIFIGLYALHTAVSLIFWSYWNGLGDAQHTDPSMRDKMNLAARPSILGSRMRPAAERLAEPARTTALRWCDRLDISFWALTAAAILIVGSYYLLLPSA